MSTGPRIRKEAERQTRERLIAVAPELMEALRPLARLQVESCSKCDQTGREGNEICPVCGGLGALVLGKPSPEEIMDARQVIAKAEGRQ